MYDPAPYKSYQSDPLQTVLESPEYAAVLEAVANLNASFGPAVSAALYERLIEQPEYAEWATNRADAVARKLAGSR